MEEVEDTCKGEKVKFCPGPSFPPDLPSTLENRNVESKRKGKTNPYTVKIIKPIYISKTNII